MRYLYYVSIICILTGCGQLKDKLTLFNVSGSDLNWSVDMNHEGIIMFIRNDSILVINKTEFIHISKTGKLEKVNYNLTPTHIGTMLSHYGSCEKTNTHYKCKVELKDSTKVEEMYLSVEGINSRLGYPKFYLSFRDRKLDRTCVLDFNTFHLQVFDIAQLNSNCFVMLYDYTPHELDKVGVKRIGFLDIEKLLKTKGSNAIDHLMKKVDK